MIVVHFLWGGFLVHALMLLTSTEPGFNEELASRYPLRSKQAPTPPNQPGEPSRFSLTEAKQVWSDYINGTHQEPRHGWILESQRTVHYPDADRKFVFKQTMHRDGEYVKTTELRDFGQPQDPRLHICNPSYVANLKKRAQDDLYSLVEVSEQNPSVPLANSSYKNNLQIAPDFSLADLLENKRVRWTASKLSDTEELIQFDCENNEFYSGSPIRSGEIVLSFDRTSYLLPIRIALQIDDEDEGVYTTTNETKYKFLPELDVHFCRYHLQTNPGMTHEFQMDYRPAESALDTEQCYLTYYDLPEPDFAKRSSTNTWLIVLSVGLFLVGAAFLFLRRNT